MRDISQLEAMQARRQWSDIFKVLKGKWKPANLESSIQQNKQTDKQPQSPNKTKPKNFQKQRWNKEFFEHTKVKELITSRTALQEVLKQILQREGKWHQMKTWVYTKRWTASEMVTTWVNILILELIKSFKKIIDYLKNYINIVWGLKYSNVK